MKARKSTPRPAPPKQLRNLHTGGVLPRTVEPAPVHLPGACPCHPRFVAPVFAPATCAVCGAGPDQHAPSCALTRAPHLERLLLRVRDELRVIDQATCSTFDGHGIRALLRVVEGEVGA